MVGDAETLENVAVDSRVAPMRASGRKRKWAFDEGSRCIYTPRSEKLS